MLGNLIRSSGWSRGGERSQEDWESGESHLRSSLLYLHCCRYTRALETLADD
jgi:hypothetical protein